MALTNDYPTIRPSLLLDFARSRALDPRITFTRATIATRVNEEGYVETVGSGVPRFDFDPVTLTSKGLLIEEQRTNLALNSASVLDTWGSTSGQLDLISCTGTDNTTTSPDGTTTGGTLEITASSGRATVIINDANGTTKNSAVTYSVYLKSNASDNATVEILCQTSGSTFTYRSWARFNFASGTVTAVTNVGIDGSTPAGVATITNVGNGWYRCSISFSTYNGANTLNATLAEIRPNSGQSSGSVYAWGRQFEAGAFPTSYIPTTTASVQRNADAASMTGTNFSSWFNNGEGTFFTQHLQPQVNAGRRVFSASDGSWNNYILLTGGVAVPAVLRTDYLVSAVAQAQLTVESTSVANGTYKIASAYKVNDFAAVSNNQSVQTDTAGTIPVMNSLYIGTAWDFANLLNGTISKIAYYPVRLTNAQLQALTRS